MRKLLLGLLSILLLALAIYIAYDGIVIGSLEINGIPAIQEDNQLLDKKIKEATDLKQINYPQENKKLEEQYQKLIKEKENYEQLLALGVDENGLPLNKIQEYEIEKIWVTMGNYAKKQGVDLKLDVTSNNTISGTYDLKFTVTGGYIQITDFLYDVERDSSLVFKLEKFKMVPNTDTDTLLVTFECKDIKLKIKGADKSTSSSNSTSTGNNTNTQQNSTSTQENSATSSNNTGE